MMRNRRRRILQGAAFALAGFAALPWLAGCSKGKCAGTAGATAVALVMDYSGSMSSRDVANAETAVRTFIGKMTGSDVGKIVKFSTKVYPHPADRFVGKSELADLLETGQDGRGGSTSLYAAMLRGLGDLGDQTRASSYERVLVAFTDGKNNNAPTGRAGVDQVIAEAKANGVTVYTAGFGDIDRNELEEIATATGGRFVAVATSADMEALYDEFAEEVFVCSEARGYLL